MFIDYVSVFEILDSCPRHRYISDKDAMCTQMLKVINKEVKILQNSLPAGIWVKMYEERMVIDKFTTWNE